MVDFLILTSDPAQYRAIERQFPGKSLAHIKSAEHDFTFTDLRPLEQERSETEPKIALAQLAGQSRARVAVEMVSILTALKPKLILLVGLAAGIKGKVKLGDIVISSRISELTPSVSVGKVGYDIHNYSNVSERLAFFCKGLHHNLDDKINRHGKKASIHFAPTTLRFSPTLCTNYLGDLHEFKKISRARPNIAAVDMESAGIAAAIEAVPKRTEFLAIFCIADFADASKTAFDRSSALDKAASFSAALVEAASDPENFLFAD